MEIKAVSLADYADVIDSSAAQAKKDGKSFVFMNLCDGVETDGYPGLSVVEYLSKAKLPYTGSGPGFYINSTSKTLLKNVRIWQCGRCACLTLKLM